LRFHEVPADDVDPYGDQGGDIIELEPLKPPAGETE
jgi:hypothetical protein